MLFSATEHLQVTPFPNKLRTEDLNMSIVRHMTSNMDFRVNDVIRFVTGNIPTSATATYQLLEKRLRNYITQKEAEVKDTSKSSARPKRVSITIFSGDGGI